jgi:TPR repeat protein
MPRITISYRRDDSLDITGRIFDRLAGHFGREAVFRDIDSIPLGTDFRRHVDRVLDESDIILAIVGPRWIGPDNEHLRLVSPADPVRLEIEAALRKDKLLIPVLVSRAVMPHPDVLPVSLHDFAYRNAVQVDSGQDFDVHVGRLIRGIEQLLRIDEERIADEGVQSATPIEPTPKAERPAEAARQAEEEKQRAEAARQAEEERQRAEAARQAEEERQQAEEEKRRAEAARQAEEEKQWAETTPKAEPPVASVAPPVGWRVIRVYGGHTVRRVLGLVVILGIIGASGWWVLVEQPTEMARREVAAEDQARQAAAAAKAQQEEQARQAAAAAKAQQEEQARQAAAAKAQVEDALKNGPAALDSKDYVEAMRWYRKAADQGNAIAQTNIGWLYEKGQGVALDYAEAMRWFRKAADQGNADAQSAIGSLYENGWGVTQDYGEAMRWFRKAADQGNAEAQNDIGYFYEYGYGVDRDYAEAMRWYRKTADQGNPLAQSEIGWLYEHGRGVARDYAEAMRWYRKAADQGDADAQYNLGSLYENGRGVAKDYNEARRWYRKAADQGNTSAKGRLKAIH